MPELPYVGDSEEAAFQALYGPWSAWTPSEAAHVLSGWDQPWWLVGGWAIDAFTGTERQHEDIDVGILRAHVPDLLAYLGKNWLCWAAGSGGPRPLSDDEDELPEWADQCWVRRHAWSPWVADFITAPDGMAYQNPELVLAFKAKVGRSKDDSDLERTWPLLDADQRAWLRSTVERLYPGHHWLESMR